MHPVVASEDLQVHRVVSAALANAVVLLALRMTRRCVGSAVCHVNRFTHCRTLWPCFAFRRQMAARPAPRLRSRRPLQARPRGTPAVAGRMVQTAPRTWQTPFRKMGSHLKSWQHGKSELIHVCLCSALGIPVRCEDIRITHTASYGTGLSHPSTDWCRVMWIPCD